MPHPGQRSRFVTVLRPDDGWSIVFASGPADNAGKGRIGFSDLFKQFGLNGERFEISNKSPCGAKDRTREGTAMNPLLELRNHNQIGSGPDYIGASDCKAGAQDRSGEGSVSCSCFSRRRLRHCRPGPAGAGSRAIPPFSKRPSTGGAAVLPVGSLSSKTWSSCPSSQRLIHRRPGARP